MAKPKPKRKQPRNADDRRKARARAYEWRQFRHNFLYTQRLLAETLGCARRTVVSIETASTLRPRADLLRKFKALQLKHEKIERQQRIERAERDPFTSASLDAQFRERRVG